MKHDEDEGNTNEEVLKALLAKYDALDQNLTNMDYNTRVKNDKIKVHFESFKSYIEKK